MSKTAVALASTGVVGAGGTGLYLTHHFGGFGDGSSSSYGSYLHLPQTLVEFQEKNGGDCLANTFSEIPNSEKISSKKSTAEDVKTGDTKLGTDKTKETTGCLVFNWKKSQNEKSKEWEGNFRFLGTLRRDTAGFAVYMTADYDATDTNNRKITFDGIAYVFGETGGKGQTKKLGIKQGSKTLASNDFASKFPKKGENFSTISYIDDWGNFLDGSGKVKAADDGFPTERKYLKGNQSNDEGLSKPVQNGSPNLDAGWKHFFDDGTNWKMLEVIQEVKGYWQ